MLRLRLRQQERAHARPALSTPYGLLKSGREGRAADGTGEAGPSNTTCSL
jgi:hypothetical protein